MTQEKIKRPVRQRRREAHERPSAEERPTDPGVSRSSIAITNRPRGTLLTRKYIEKGRFWEPSFWAMVCCRKHTEGVHHELNNRADKLRDRCLSRIFSAAPANHSPGSLLSFLISAGIAGGPLSYDLHSGDSAGAPQGAKKRRRQFVSSTISAAAISCLPNGRDPFTSFASPKSATSEIAERSSVVLTPAPSWRDQGILNLLKSPYAKLRNVAVHAVTIENGFWAQRREVNVSKSIPSMGKLLEANGRIDNFRRLIGKSTAAQRGPVYSDSDVYKWTEAASFALQSGERSELHAAVDNIAKDMMAAQQPDGYLNTYYIGEHASQRMEPKVQQWGHELYNMGHFLQGATAYYRATGDRALLDAGIRFVNEFLLPNFGAGADKKPLFSGHPEIELALVELYRIDRRQTAAGPRRLPPRGRPADSRAALGLRLSFLRNSLHLANPSRRSCRARHVRLLRGGRLLPGNRRSGVLENAQRFVEGSRYITNVRHRRSWGAHRRRSLR